MKKAPTGWNCSWNRGSAKLLAVFVVDADEKELLTLLEKRGSPCVNNRPRVVIVGGGFGGLYAARGLAGGSRRYRSGGGVLHCR